MRMFVSIPKLPKCICDAVHAQKQHFLNFKHKVLSKTEKNKFRIDESIGFFDWHEICGAQNLIDHN
jgi:hypothetical protein